MDPLMKTPRPDARGARSAVAMTRSTAERAMSTVGLIMALLLVAVVLAGCTTTGGRGGSFCDTARPIRPSAESHAAMNDVEVEEMLTQLEFGASACGWRP